MATMAVRWGAMARGGLPAAKEMYGVEAELSSSIKDSLNSLKESRRSSVDGRQVNVLQVEWRIGWE